MAEKGNPNPQRYNYKANTQRRKKNPPGTAIYDNPTKGL
jgi:hypothetical protein